MAVLSSTLVYNQELNAEFTLERARSYVLKYNLRTDGNMGPISLYTGALVAAPDPLPDIWDTYSCLGDTDLDAYCNRIATRRKDSRLYEAVCTFGTLPRGQDPGNAQLAIASRPVRYRGAKLVAARVVTKDVAGKPLTTSAGEEFDEALEEEIVYPVLVATRPIANLDVWIGSMAAFLGSVNSAPYRGQAARRWWCMDIDVSDQIHESGVSYFEETWSLAYSFETWDEQILDRGWKVLEGDAPNQKRVNATDDNGQGVSAPVLLDGLGKKLGVGLDPVALTKRVKREVNWQTIPV